MPRLGNPTNDLVWNATDDVTRFSVNVRFHYVLALTVSKQKNIVIFILIHFEMLLSTECSCCTDGNTNDDTFFVIISYNVALQRLYPFITGSIENSRNLRLVDRIMKICIRRRAVADLRCRARTRISSADVTFAGELSPQNEKCQNIH